MGAQFTVPLIVVIPGQLIASSLWNNEWNNLAINLIPAGIDSYSDTDTQMQIQTNPFPGGVTSHATSLGGELERLRFQLALAMGTVFWYDSPKSGTPTFGNLTLDNGAGNSIFFSLSPGGVRQGGMAVDVSDTYLDFGGNFGSGNGRLLFRPFAGGTATDAMILNPTFLDLQNHQIRNVAPPTVAGDVITFGPSVISGAASNAGPVGQIVAETVSTPDIRPLAITPGLLGNVAGAGISGGAGNVINANVDNATLDVNGSNLIEVKAGGIGIAQIAAGANPVLTTGGYSSTAGAPTQVVNVSGRGRILSISIISNGSGGSITLTAVLDGVTKSSVTLSGAAQQTINYIAPNGAAVVTTITPFGLDFSSSASISLSGSNTKTLVVAYVTP